MTRIIHLFIGQGPDRAAGRLADAFRAAVPGTTHRIQWGINGLFIAGHAIELQAQVGPRSDIMQHAFGYFTNMQREEAQASRASMVAAHPKLASILADSGPLPLLCAVVEQDSVRLYHQVHHTVGGVLYLCLALSLIHISEPTRPY